MNGPWMDEFHKEFPKIPIGMSEYGCEALNWHTLRSEAGRLYRGISGTLS